MASITFDTEELNPYKRIWVLLFLGVFGLLFISSLLPQKTEFVGIYTTFWFFLFIILVVDWMFKDELYPLDTITIDENDKKYILQKHGIGINTCVIISVVIGIVWGLFYIHQIRMFQVPNIWFPTFFSSTPFVTFMGSRLFEIITTSIIPAFIEEKMIGVLNATGFGILYVGFSASIHNDDARLYLSWVVSIIFAAIAFAYIMHTTVYAGSPDLILRAFIHAILSGTAQAITGTILAGVIAHAANNAGCGIFLSFGHTAAGAILGLFQ